VLEAAKVLHIKEHSVLDGSGNPIKLAAPVECKGIIGSDDRHYLLDLMRVTPRDANYVGEGSRFCVLRPELVSSFCQDVTEKESETAQPNESVPIAASSCEDILLNPNVLTEFPLAGCEEVYAAQIFFGVDTNLMNFAFNQEIATDEALVEKAGSYLVDVVIPKFVKDLNTLEVSPMDGQTLAEALHAHGINVRYLGKIAKMTKHLPHIWDLCVTEIIVRSAKHILKDILRQCEDHDLGFTMSQFLNCFLGHDVTSTVKNNISNMRSRAARKVSREPTQNSLKGQRNSSNAATALKHHVAYAHITSEVVWSGIEDFAKHKYQFTLPDDAKLQVRKVSTIRNLCQKLGISIAARKYDFDATCPFQTSDVMDLQPVVKHSVPVCMEAKDLIETGKLRLAEGMLNEAYSLFSEAFSILQQVTGPMHREVANCCRYLAMVLYHAGDMAGAIIQQHKDYGNMALFYHGLNQTELALRYMSRTLLLLSLSCGSDHPDVAATFINVAMMYQDIGKMNIALRYLQEALKKNERLLGQEHIQTAVCYHALAIAFNCIGAYKLSLQHERRTYDILVKQLGEDDSRTRDSQNWINTFKLRDIQVSAQKQKGQIASAASTQKAIDILKAHPDLMQAFQVAAGGGSVSSGTPMNKNLSAAMMGEAIPRGRGVDERAARAAAEVRKKAAARGLLIRPQGISVQTLPQLTQLLNIINSGATDAQPIESNNSLANGSSKDDGLTVGQEVQTPVGLGAGLASLDSKRKLKSNSTS
ncbi:Clustered mitochondria protein, partial [Nymphaea thermarum]